MLSMVTGTSHPRLIFSMVNGTKHLRPIFSIVTGTSSDMKMPGKGQIMIRASS
jgi:hypothetical protein